VSVAHNNKNNNKKYVLSNSESVQRKLFHLCACVVSRDPGAWDLKRPHIWNRRPQLAYSLYNFCGATMRIKVIFADFCPFSVHNLGVLWVIWRITYTKIFTPKAPCGIRGCKNGPAPFPGRMYKATKPGLVFVLYLSMFLLCCCLLGPLFMYC